MEMKKLGTILVALLVIISFTGCGSKPDYTEEKAEAALNDGKDLKGKTVKIKVTEFIEDGPLGHTIQAGEHLNFISSENPKVKAGDELIVKIKAVESALGSYLIDYEKVK
jgi:predicted small lipoprotein YifL